MKLFTQEEAAALLPIVAPMMEELWTTRRDLAILLLGQGKPDEVARLKAQVIATISRVESHGCIVKDLDLGLLDFPSLLNNKPVFLCWKNGEPQITHWHSPEEGFHARKELGSGA